MHMQFCHKTYDSCMCNIATISDGAYWRPTYAVAPNIFVIKPLVIFLLLLTSATLPFITQSRLPEREVAVPTMVSSAKVLIAALLVLAVVVEAQNIKMTDDAAADLHAIRPIQQRCDLNIRWPPGTDSNIPGFDSILGGSNTPA
jgi:hypothetical protein